jgi:hypothetical protein
MIHFPPPVSSAGVPIKMSVLVRLKVFMAAETPTAEAREVAIRLWPQTWPISGRASGGVSISSHVVIFAIFVSVLRAAYHTQHYSKLFDHLL